MMNPLAPSESQEAKILNPFGVLILSAGASRRMGSPKALLPWGKTFILEHLIALWKSAGAAQIAVVFAPDDPAISAELDRLQITSRIPNPNAIAGGMMSSLRAAAAWGGWNAGINRVVIALVDQPHISGATLAALITFSGENPGKICQPQFGERHGHPVFLPKPVFNDLAIAPEPDLRAFIRRRAFLRAFLLCSDAAVTSDMDTPDAYQAALRKAT